MNFSIFLAIVTIWAVKICSSHPITRSNTTVIRPGYYPYQGVIRFVSDRKIFLLCEGAIIDKKWILTAAGCVDKYESNKEIKLDVVAGITSTKDIESEPHAQVRKVSRINISPLWVTSKKTAGDIALIELIKPFTFNKFVNKAIFGKNATVNETAQLVGYGNSKNLTLTELKIISKQECNLKTNDNTAELICARKNSSRYAFNDESFAGAPLVNSTNSDSSRDEIVGIVSGKGRHFTSVAHHKNWVERVTKIKPSNADDTNALDLSEEESYASDDGGAPGGSNNTKNGTSTTKPSPSSDDDSSESESESSEEVETTTEDTTDSIEDSNSDETSEETSTSSSTTEQSDETEDSESIEESSTAEDTSTDATEEYDDEDTEETTTSSDYSDETTESDESEESTESQPTTATTSSPNTTQTSAPTSTTITTLSTTMHPETTTSTPTSQPSTSSPSTTATAATTTKPSPTSPTTTSSTSTTTTPSPTSSTTTSTTENEYDYPDDDYSNPNNRDQNIPNSFDKDNHDNKINSDDFTGSNAVTSNSAQPSNPSLISNMISKIKNFKIFFAV